jgi:hypothetical protein
MTDQGRDVDPAAAFGKIVSWLLFKLTGRHVTDYSNVRTLRRQARDAARGMAGGPRPRHE